jgi:3-deoxy-D-manno-octulosonic-acid transferase
MLLYRLILTLLTPVLLGAGLIRVLKGRETLADLSQRLGLVRGFGPGPKGAIWLHGASNGELTSARPLLEALCGAVPGRCFVVTANTTSGRDLVEGWQVPQVTARLAPLDLRLSLAMFRARWRPAALIILENELWPNRMVTGLEPVLCIGARLSEGSAKTWARFPRLARQILGRIAYLSPQDEGSATRFHALGLAMDRIGPVMSLKPDVVLGEPDGDEFATFAAYFPRADTILAASTHEGEEEIILDAFGMARQSRPNLRLILAPRHPRRATEISALIKARGLSHTKRSLGESPGAEVYLADTLGEMALWYRLAGVSFIGGSLCQRGGHTPFEPAQAGSAILHGPDVANFQAVYAQLDQAKAALVVTDAQNLARAIIGLDSARSQTELAQRARATLASLKTDLDPLIQAILRLID